MPSPPVLRAASVPSWRGIRLSMWSRMKLPTLAGAVEVLVDPLDRLHRLVVAELPLVGRGLHRRRGRDEEDHADARVDRGLERHGLGRGVVGLDHETADAALQAPG